MNLRVWHHQIIDWMLANPGGSMVECAKNFQVSYQWLCAVTRADDFQEEVTRRRASLATALNSAIEAKLMAIVELGVDTIERRLMKQPDTVKAGDLVRVTEMAMRGLNIGGFGRDASAGPVQINNTLLVTQSDLDEARARIRQRQSQIATPEEKMAQRQLEHNPGSVIEGEFAEVNELETAVVASSSGPRDGAGAGGAAHDPDANEG